MMISACNQSFIRLKLLREETSQSFSIHLTIEKEKTKDGATNILRSDHGQQELASFCFKT